MAVISVIVQAHDDCGGLVSEGLSSLTGVSVYGIKEDQVVTVLEGDNMEDVNVLMRQIRDIPEVIGVFPVYGTDYDNA